jgi:hypothetical protein
LRSTTTFNDVSVSVQIGNIQPNFSIVTNARETPDNRDLLQSQIAQREAPTGTGDER